MTPYQYVTLSTVLILTLQSRALLAQDSDTRVGDQAPTATAQSLSASEQPTVYTVIRPAIQSGYVPYSYPAVGTCRCGDDQCFHPHRYYCCNSAAAYRKCWFRKWVGTQFGKRSMLDDYPCDCINPTFVPRPYYRAVKTVPVEPPSVPAVE
jgi:hypothetical protein